MTPSRYLAAVALAALALAGCGGDDEKKSSDTDRAPSTATETATTEAKTETAKTEAGDDKQFEDKVKTTEGTGGAKSPEDQPGGAGDEVPASSQALFTGKGGRITPDTISVPPFLAISAKLRSADGKSYTLKGGGRTLAVGGDIRERSTTFSGLRPGKAIVLRGPQGNVTVVADAEPGP
jgi:hypothetical protein